MPRLTVWSIRAALVYLTVGFTLGALMLANKGFPISPLLWRLLPAHIDLLVFGWTTQLVLGMGFWILPRFSRQPKRGNVPLAWFSIVLLNLGVWLAGFGPEFSSSPWLPVAGRAAELSSLVAFAAHAWRRIKAPGA